MPVKLLFSIHVIDCVMPANAFDDEVGDDPIILSVCFERGHKISASKGMELDLQNFDDERTRENIILTFNERVELCATLFQDPKSGKFLEKEGKVLLRKLKTKTKSGNVVETYKGIGLQVIKLHELAAELGYERMMTQELMIPLKLMKNSAMRAIVTTRLLRNERGNDDQSEDGMSEASFSSDTSMIGASFSFDSRMQNPHSISGWDQPPGSLGLASGSQDIDSSLQRTTYLTDEEEEPMRLNSVDDG